MPWWLIARAGLAQDPGSVPNTYIQQLTIPATQGQGIFALFWLPQTLGTH